MRLVSRAGNWTLIVFIINLVAARFPDFGRGTKDFRSQSFRNSNAASMKLARSMTRSPFSLRDLQMSLPNGRTSGKVKVR